jgi:hypothetical protein
MTLSLVPTNLPSHFLSHGAPTLPLTNTPARAFLQELGGLLPRPRMPPVKRCDTRSWLPYRKPNPTLE